MTIPHLLPRKLSERQDLLIDDVHIDQVGCSDLLLLSRSESHIFCHIRVRVRESSAFWEEIIEIEAGNPGIQSLVIKDIIVDKPILEGLAIDEGRR